jgi:hypothetical protein
LSLTLDNSFYTHGFLPLDDYFGNLCFMLQRGTGSERISNVTCRVPLGLIRKMAGSTHLLANKLIKFSPRIAQIKSTFHNLLCSRSDKFIFKGSWRKLLFYFIYFNREINAVFGKGFRFGCISSAPVKDSWTSGTDSPYQRFALSDKHYFFVLKHSGKVERNIILTFFQ